MAGNAATDDVLYRYHVANLRSIARAIKEVETLTKRSIKERSDSTVAPLLRTHLLLAGAWTECRLKKLLYETGGFNATERAQIRTVRAQENRWKTTVDLGFKRRYQVADLDAASLGQIEFTRYQAISSAITNDIAPVITLRNRLAHGQWAHILTSSEDRISERDMTKIQNENLLSSKFKLNIIGHIAYIIHDLVASSSFERDFDKHYNFFDQAQQRLHKCDYQDYVNELRRRYDRGQKIKQNS